MAEFHLDTRGQSNTIGAILVLAVVVTGITAIGVVGFGGLTDSAENARVAGVENELEEFSGTVQSVAFSDSSTRVHEFSYQNEKQSGQIRADQSAGRIVVEVGGTTQIDESFGKVEYVHPESNSQMAYQGGGIFTDYSDGPVEVASAPPLSMTEEGDENSFTVPVMRVQTVDGQSSLSAGAQVTLIDKQSEYDSLYVPSSDSVTMTITSEYAEGWAAYLNETVTSGTVEYPYNGNENKVQYTYDSANHNGFYLHLTEYIIEVRSK